MLARFRFVLIAASGLLLAPSAAPAQAKSFKIGGPPTQRVVTFENDSPIENFTGKTSNVAGTLFFDPARRTGSGEIVVEASSLDTGIAKRNEQLWSAQWLDVKQFPTITFKTTQVRHVEGDEYRVTGDFTLHGVKRRISLTAVARYLKESEATRKAGLKGDVLQVRAMFRIKLGDYGIKIPANLVSEIAEEVKLTVGLYAQSGL